MRCVPSESHSYFCTTWRTAYLSRCAPNGERQFSVPNLISRVDLLAFEFPSVSKRKTHKYILLKLGKVSAVVLCRVCHDEDPYSVMILISACTCRYHESESTNYLLNKLQVIFKSFLSLFFFNFLFSKVFFSSASHEIQSKMLLELSSNLEYFSRD